MSLASHGMVARRPAGSRLGIAAAAIAIVTDAFYLGIIVTQDPVEWGRVGAVATVIFAMGVSAGAGAVGAIARPTRLVLLAIGAGGLLTLGYLGLFSIGLPLFVGGILSAVAWQRVWVEAGSGGARQVLPSALGFFAAALVPFAAVIVS
jgi:hypothetical protein